MPAPVICPSCGERLDIPADLRGTPVRCAACMTVFTPPPADAADAADVPPVRPARPAARPRPPTEDGDEYPDDRARPRRRKRGGLGWVWVLFGGLGLTTCACCGGCGALVWFVENPTVQAYSSDEGRFAVEFPGPAYPKRLPLGDGEPMKGVESRRDMFQESYFVHYTDLPARRVKDGSEKVLEEAAAEFLKTVRPGQSTKQLGTHAGYPAMDVVVHPPGPFETGTVARVVLVGRRLYVVGVTGQVMPETARVERFFHSFQVTDPADKKKDEAKK